MTSESMARVSADVEGNQISFETGKLAKQANGAVVVRAGDTHGALHRDRRQPA